ncbi:MAG: hypothetical protein WAK40_06710 [Thermoplasmata archaeon]
MSGVSSIVVEDYVILALFGLFLLRRTYRMTQGVPAGTGRLVILPVFYVALYTAELAGTWFAGIGSGRAELTYFALAADAVMLAIGTAVSYRVTSRHVELYQPTSGGAWYYRLRPLLPVLYLVLFFARAVIQTVIVGTTPFGFPTTAQFDTITPIALYALFTVDALWGLTTGFLIGRSGAVYGAWKRAERNPPPPHPLPS